MTYSEFQRLDEASAYSKMRSEKIESEAQEREEILDKCEEASNKIEKGAEELFQALQTYHDLREEKEKNND